MQKTVNKSTGESTLQRSSNLELFRIITMLLIIAHHYVVNSGLMNADGPMRANPLAFNTVFLWLFGAWGKTGINCFVLITGYFMCRSKITVKKFMKLLLEIMFYKIAIYAIFLITGYVQFSADGLIRALLPLYSVAQNFPGCFLLFYLLIPFLNITLQHMNERQHLRLVVLLGFIYVILGSVFGANVQFNYVTWFVVLYFVAAYVRMYPKALFDNTRLWAALAAGTLLICVACILGFHFLGQKIKVVNGYSLMTDSNKILAFAAAFCGFMFFKNVNIKQSRFINTVAASVFGVLLIHSGSAQMRTLVWVDILQVTQVYESPFMIVHAFFSIIAIFTVCTVIDYLRIHFLEKPFFAIWDKKWPVLKAAYTEKENKICEKLGIDLTDK